MKLKILKFYVPSQFNFELKLYDLSATWIEQNLDTPTVNFVRGWLSLPVSSCVSEILSLPRKFAGLDIKSFKDINQTLQLKNRIYLKYSVNTSMHELWKQTPEKHIETDSRFTSNIFPPILNQLKEDQIQTKRSHIESLSLQGAVYTSVLNCLPSSEVIRWSKTTESLPDHLFKFCRKAMSQQLPTNANLKRWKRIESASCNLCSNSQTNKHVLSNCSSAVALDRFLIRHNAILSLLADWLQSVLNMANFNLCVNLEGGFAPINTVFETLRPDIVIYSQTNIYTLELTICHETNLKASELRKDSKYSNLESNLKQDFSHYKIFKHYLQISTLGFISDISNFCSACNILDMPCDLKNKITMLAIQKIFDIYCRRNSPA